MNIQSIIALRQQMANSGQTPAQIIQEKEIRETTGKIKNISIDDDELDDFDEKINEIITEKPKKNKVREFFKEYTKYLEDEIEDE